MYSTYQLISIFFCLEQIGTDVIVGWRTESGEAVIQDRWGTRMLLVDSVVVLMTMGSNEMWLLFFRKATGYSEPLLDAQQDATLLSSSRVDSVTTLTFRRPLATNDNNDISLSYNCVYFIYARGGTYTESKGITYHDNTPIISNKKICIPCAEG